MLYILDFYGHMYNETIILIVDFCVLKLKYSTWSLVISLLIRVEFFFTHVSVLRAIPFF